MCVCVCVCVCACMGWKCTTLTPLVLFPSILLILAQSTHFMSKSPEFRDINQNNTTIENIEAKMKSFGQKSELVLVAENDTSVLRR